MAGAFRSRSACTASFTQMAGVEALRGDQASVTKMNQEFMRRRDYFAERIGSDTLLARIVTPVKDF